MSERNDAGSDAGTRCSVLTEARPADDEPGMQAGHAVAAVAQAAPLAQQAAQEAGLPIEFLTRVLGIERQGPFCARHRVPAGGSLSVPAGPRKSTHACLIGPCRALDVQPY